MVSLVHVHLNKEKDDVQQIFLNRIQNIKYIDTTKRGNNKSRDMKSSLRSNQQRPHEIGNQRGWLVLSVVSRKVAEVYYGYQNTGTQ